MKYTNYLFDLYGTLADIHTNETKKTLWQSLAGWYCSHGAAYTPWEIKSAYAALAAQEKKKIKEEHPEFSAIDIPIEHVFDALYKKKDVAVSADTVHETAYFFRTLSRSYVRLYPAIRPMLTELAAQGKHCYLLTNAQHVFTMPELSFLGITNLFDDIFISSDACCAKPDPHFFADACERYQLDKAQTLMVGNDPRTDIAGANAFGIDSVYIHSNLSPRFTGAPQSTYTIANGDTQVLKKMLLSF